MKRAARRAPGAAASQPRGRHAEALAALLSPLRRLRAGERRAAHTVDDAEGIVRVSHVGPRGGCYKAVERIRR
jgi:hypothetical protein